MTLQVPIRLRTLIGLTDVVKAITPANGFQSDLSDFVDPDDATVMRSRVFRGRNTFGQDDPIPMVCILENPHAEPGLHDSPRGAPVVVGPWELLLQGFVEDDKQNPSDPAHYLMADVKKALVQVRTQLQPRSGGNLYPNLFGAGRGVTDMQIGSGVVRPPDEVSDKACFWLTLTLQMAEDLGNPFA